MRRANLLNSLIHPLRPSGSLAERTAELSNRKKGISLAGERIHPCSIHSLCICTIKFTAFAGAGISGRKGQALLIFPPPTETSNPPCTRVIRSSAAAVRAAKAPLLFALLPELEFAGEAGGNFSSLDKFVFYGHAKKMSECGRWQRSRTVGPCTRL